LIGEFGAHTAGKNEPSRPWIRIDSSLRGTQYRGDFLPFVEEEGLTAVAQSGIRVCHEGGGLSRLIEAYDLGGHS
jgi:hypothetical protein